ncbi:hypothetical protein [Actinoplanes subtropicus]|uniref:hypothetical protein n=1 Tax=Actinoplanes subtropicus TaxID=543632 RepID=UPI0012F9D6AA|nr:hypothetical protein [Actinoplanes subtropicus]
MSPNDPVSGYTHSPGAPILDRAAARLSLNGFGRLGSAIARGDRVVVAATGRTVIVTAVDHQTGRVLARPEDGGRAVEYAGIDVEVTAAAHHPPLADDCLEGLTIQQARALMTPVASDNGRYPQYGPEHFDRWVFGRARRDVPLRGETILVAGQRCLINPVGPGAGCGLGPRAYTAWITRRAHHGGAVSVWAYDIDLEPTGGDR